MPPNTNLTINVAQLNSSDPATFGNCPCLNDSSILGAAVPAPAPTPAPAPAPSVSSSSSGLSGGAIAGIVVGAIAGVALIAGVIAFFVMKKGKAAALGAKVGC